MFNIFHNLEIKRGKSFPSILVLLSSARVLLTPIFGVGIELAKLARINLTPFYGVEMGVVDNDRVYKQHLLYIDARSKFINQ